MPHERFLTPEEIREADRRCIEELGLPGAVLMNNAGTAVFNEIKAAPVGIVCGKGNNGGDGFVTARLAFLSGMETRLLVLGGPDEIAGDARCFLDIYRKLGAPVKFLSEAAAVAEAMKDFAGCVFMVDAMLGTGAAGKVREPLRSAIAHWPDAPTISVDVPSGMNAATGEIADVCIRASVTVTMQFPKAGFSAPAAKDHLGRLVVADIGIPKVCADDDAWAELKENWRRL